MIAAPEHAALFASRPVAAVEPILLTTAEVALLLRISTRQVQRLVDRGELPAPIAVGRRPRWRRADLERFIRGARRETR